MALRSSILNPRYSLLTCWLPAAVLAAGLLAYSAVQAPAPGVNEPQYLGKAKHLWDPGWCPGDFFLDSSNPHLVFYVAVGWLTRFLSLETTAWVSRAAGYALLAVGWAMLARRVAGSRWAAIPSAAVFLLLASLGYLADSENRLLDALSSFGSLSGEWLVGGIEGKVFSYALLFAAIAFWLHGRTIAAAACLGGSVSFHPIVGAWGFVCGAAAELVTRWRSPESNPTGHGRPGRLAPAAVFLLTALPGLIPALLTLGGAEPQDAARATYMQVFIRLRHHLDPMQFPAERYAGYAVLLAASMFLLAKCPVRGQGSPDDAPRWPDSLDRAVRHGVSDHVQSARWFALFVLATVVVAAVGVVAGWHDGDAWGMPLRSARGTLLKFYPFRLADLFVPLAFSLAVTRVIAGGPGFRGAAVAGTVTVAAFAVALAIPSPDRNPSRMGPDRLAAWTDVGRWVRENTPPDAVIVSPSRQWGFRWFAGRAVYVDYKDAPQDTPGLLEWERRLGVLRDWWESSRRYTPADLRRLGERTGGDYLVTSAFPGRFTAAPVYANRTYRVYALRPR